MIRVSSGQEFLLAEDVPALPLEQHKAEIAALLTNP